MKGRTVPSYPVARVQAAQDLFTAHGDAMLAAAATLPRTLRLGDGRKLVVARSMSGGLAYRCSVRPSGRPGPVRGICCSGETWADAAAIEATTLAWIGALGLVPDLLDRARARLHTPPPARPPHEALRALKADFLAERIDANEYTTRRAALAQPVPPPPRRRTTRRSWRCCRRCQPCSRTPRRLSAGPCWRSS